jgi:hypothetical protein
MANKRIIKPKGVISSVVIIVMRVSTIVDFHVVLKEDCRNLSLGLTTKARAYKRCRPKVSPRITFHAPESARKCEGMNPHLLSEVSFWELDSQWTFKSSEGNCRGPNSLD